MSFSISNAILVERILLISSIILAFGVLSMGTLMLLRYVQKKPDGSSAKAPTNDPNARLESLERELAATRNEAKKFLAEMSKVASHGIAQVHEAATNHLSRIAAAAIDLNFGHPLARQAATSSDVGRTLRSAHEAPLKVAKSVPAAEAGRWLSEMLVEQIEPDEIAVWSSTIDSLTRDISSIVNSEAVIEFWERLNRGEEEIKIDLFTPSGFAIFETVQARYQTDADFRETADKYLARFETLLAGTHSGATSLYLNSETGKTYLLLALAAGRPLQPVGELKSPT